MSALPLFPLQHVVFPGGVLQLQIFEVRYLHLMRRCQQSGLPFGIVGLLEGREVRVPEATEVLTQAGSLAHLESLETPQPGLMRVSCRIGARFRVQQAAVGQYGLWLGQVDAVADDPPTPVPPALQRCVQWLEQAIADSAARGDAERWVREPYAMSDAGWVANRLAEALPIAVASKADLLLEEPVARLAWLDGWLDARGAWAS